FFLFFAITNILHDRFRIIRERSCIYIKTRQIEFLTIRERSRKMVLIAGSHGTIYVPWALLMPDSFPAAARSQSGWGRPQPPPSVRRSCCSSTTANPPAGVPTLSAPGSGACIAGVVGILSRAVGSGPRTGAARQSL